MDVPWPILTATLSSSSSSPTSTDFSLPSSSPAQRERQRNAAIVRMMMPTLGYEDDSASARGGRLKRALLKRRRRGEVGEATRTREDGDGLQTMEETEEPPPPSYDELFGPANNLPAVSSFSSPPSFPPPASSPTYSRFADSHLLPASSVVSPPTFHRPPHPTRSTTSTSTSSSTSPSSPSPSSLLPPGYIRRASLDSGYESLGSRAPTVVGDGAEGNEGGEEEETGGNERRGRRENRWKKFGRAWAPSRIRLSISSLSDAVSSYEPFDGPNGQWQEERGRGYYF